MAEPYPDATVEVIVNGVRRAQVVVPHDQVASAIRAGVDPLVPVLRQIALVIEQNTQTAQRRRPTLILPGTAEPPRGQ
ncbi:MAG: hypothetical protein ACRYHQ_41070 [Janthinobacterium lividum]